MSSRKELLLAGLSASAAGSSIVAEAANHPEEKKRARKKNWRKRSMAAWRGAYQWDGVVQCDSRQTSVLGVDKRPTAMIANSRCPMARPGRVQSMLQREKRWVER